LDDAVAGLPDQHDSRTEANTVQSTSAQAAALGKWSTDSSAWSPCCNTLPTSSPHDDRRLTEVANEIAVAVVLLEDKALKNCKIEYEPNILPDGRMIDFVVDRGKDSLLTQSA
jgi:hypothetical protein